MSFRIYLSPPVVGPLEEEYVLDALRSGWVAPLGPHVDAFEREIAEFVGVEHAVALSSGTAGLHLALLALGVGPGDEVIVPTLTFAATAFAVTYTGASPVFVDSEPESYNLCPELLRDALKSRAAEGRLPAAVIVVDIFGQTADYDRILPLCDEFGVPVIEDAAEALGATHRLGNAGTFGRAAIFSFNGNKIMTTSGGGMLVTQDAEVAARVRHLATQARQPVPWYEHHEIGFNYRMSNVLAAIGRAQLLSLPDNIQRRREIRLSYEVALAESEAFPIKDAPWGSSNGWLTVLRLPGGQQEAVGARLAADGIETRRTWYPMHRQRAFAGADQWLSGVSDELFMHGLCLPSGLGVDSNVIEEVASAVRSELHGVGLSYGS